MLSAPCTQVQDGPFQRIGRPLSKISGARAGFDPVKLSSVRYILYATRIWLANQPTHRSPSLPCVHVMRVM